MIALAIVTSLRAIAMMTSLWGFPRFFRRFATRVRMHVFPERCVIHGSENGAMT
jgi:hypothetical protein